MFYYTNTWCTAACMILMHFTHHHTLQVTAIKRRVVSGNTNWGRDTFSIESQYTMYFPESKDSDKQYHAKFPMEKYGLPYKAVIKVSQELEEDSDMMGNYSDIFSWEVFTSCVEIFHCLKLRCRQYVRR